MPNKCLLPQRMENAENQERNMSAYRMVALNVDYFLKD